MIGPRRDHRGPRDGNHAVRHTVLALTMLWGVGACAFPRWHGPRPPGTDAAGFDVRLAARLLAMTDQRRPDTLLLDEALAAPHRDLRARAVLAIGQLRVRGRYPHLRRRLLDGDTAVAANAAYAAGIARDTGALVALTGALDGASDVVAREAAWSLGEIGEPARDALVARLAGGPAAGRPGAPLGRRAPSVRAAALLALAKLRPVPEEALLPWLRDPDADVVRAAAYVVGRTRLAAGVRPILALQAVADEETRQHVARALSRTSAGDSLAAEATAALLVLARDASDRVRINAVRSLATFGPPVADVVLRMLRDPGPNVRVAASENLAELLGPDSTRWRDAWTADTALVMRQSVLGQAQRVLPTLFAEVPAQWAEHSDWQYRLAALGTAGVPVDTALAQRLVADPDPRVRRAARQRLGVRDGAPPRSGGSPVPGAEVQRPLAEYEQLVRDWVRPGAPQPRAIIDTERGSITLDLFAREAPLVVEAFRRLARTGAYRNTIFHRVVPNFVVQDGDVAADGRAVDRFTLRESWTRERHGRGCLGLATAGPDTGGSQYYLCHSPQPHLDGAYTVFGRVVEGLEVMDALRQGDRMWRIRVR